jgi:hypothetical protein
MVFSNHFSALFEKQFFGKITISIKLTCPLSLIIIDEHKFITMIKFIFDITNLTLLCLAAFICIVILKSIFLRLCPLKSNVYNLLTCITSIALPLKKIELIRICLQFYLAISILLIHSRIVFEF